MSMKNYFFKIFKTKILKITLGVLCVFLINQTFAQTIEGFVKDTNEESLPFVNIVLYSLPDSVFMGGTTSDINGHFTIEDSDILANNGFLKFSSIGYETVSIQAKKNMGDILLKEALTSIDEITVKAHRPIVKQEEGRLMVNISGTVLSKAGTAFDALRRSPGLLVDNNDNITVFGKGNPIIFLNGREVKDNAEIATLQSSDIVSFEIDRNPSAEYSASGNAVLKIITKKITEDRLNFQLYNYTYMGRKFRDIIGANLNGKTGRTNYTFNYSFRHFNYENLEDAYEINTQPNYTLTNKNSAVRCPTINTHNLFVSANHAFSDKHSLGVQVSFKREKIDGNSNSDQTIEKTNSPTVNRNILKKSGRNNDLSTYSFNYLFKIDSVSSLSAVADYSKADDISSENIKEYNLTNQSLLHSLIASENYFDVYSGRVDYNTSLWKRLELKAGGKFSGVNKDGITSATDVLSSENRYTDTNVINDRIAAVYSKINYRINSTSIGAGLRYEHTSTKVKSGQETVIDSLYGNWFPSLMLSKEVSPNVSLALSYVKKISRPSFRELSTDIIYFDANSYSQGNPKIKPTLKNSFSLDISLFRKLNINTGYRQETNARVLSAVNDEDNPNIVKYTPVNVDEAQYLFTNIDYTMSHNWYGNTVSVGLEKPFMEIPYQGGLMKVRKLSYFFKINNNFTISKRTSAFADFIYISEQEDLMTWYDSRYKLSIGFNTSFLEDKLKVSILANDILNSSDTSWEDRFGNIVAGSIPDHDNTWIRLSVKYNFNNFKNGIRKKSAGEDELNRM